MKRLTVVIFVMLICIISATSWCSAGTTDINKLGSLLIFPKITTISPKDTLVSIANISENKGVWVKCYWEYKSTPSNDISGCYLSDFMFYMRPHKALNFYASSGLRLDDKAVVAGFGEGYEGALKCWAVDSEASTQVVHNWLKGEATILETALPSSAWEYNAWRFAAKDAGDPGHIEMDSTHFDTCPKYLIFHFDAEANGSAGYAINDLALIPCIEDLQQGASEKATKANFTIWNENEVKYTGAHYCIKCASEFLLSEVKIGSMKVFTVARLHTATGKFRVQGVKSDSVCGTSTIATALLGVISSQLTFGAQTRADWVGTNPTTAGEETANPGEIWWDAGELTPDKIFR
jgi:hypothetical protein